MSPTKAWKDLEYRDTLSPDELAALAPNPAGEPLGDGELHLLAGGGAPTITSWFCGALVTVSLAKCTDRSYCGTCGILSQGCC